MSRISAFLIALAIASGASSAQAQGQNCAAGTHCDVMIARLMITGEDCGTFDGSQTVEYSQLATAARDFSVFPIGLLYPVYAYDERLDGSYSTDDPGFTAVPLPCNQEPALAPIPGSRGLYTDFLTEFPTGGGEPRNILYWDGADTNGNGLDVSDVSWGPVPLDEIMRLDELGTQAVADGGTSEIEGLLIDTASSSGSIHDHVDFELRRAGGGLPTNGVYMIKLDLTVPGFAEGAPTHYVFSTVSIPIDAEVIAREQVEQEIVVALCDDGVDNDRDGLIDYAGGDPGCDSPGDDSEKGPDYECDDGIDNDGDGLIDHRSDPFGVANIYASRDPECDSQGPMGTSEVPEPSAAMGLMAGTLALLGLRRRRSRLNCRA